MNYLLVLTVVIAACAANVVKDPIQGFKDGDRYFYFPGDGDDTLHLVDTQAPVDDELIRDYARNPQNNGYWLYTRNNPTSAQVIQSHNSQSLQNSNYAASKTTVFLAHGWNGHGNNDMNQLLRNAFLQREDVNVIVLDWNQLANSNYMTAKNGVPAVGVHLGQFINWLVSLGASYDKVHLVGFSLGGHLVGAAGRTTGSQVKRITALDPAGPLWGNDNNRVAPSDGRYVEVIHTNINLLGFTDTCGHADFYPNGGSSMPGCWTSSCSHGRAFEYMAATVLHNHLFANQCSNLNAAIQNNCSGWSFPMGNDDLNKFGTGIFRGNTGSNFPF